ncbi:toxic anion resistance protein [Streptomyces sp. NP160]|uniref:toxic anion resistance protein n=1 Tax=Streptomyces sp. NP160 TaxID=2586637 RepID=UPI0011195E4C|nr:toxic anion resistance protein [Streptomyces sp. NP160]TNM61063.1 toxic anion resistance protein [Streptomyces sp. NP160]
MPDPSDSSLDLGAAPGAPTPAGAGPRGLDLTPAAPVPAVPEDEAEGMVPLDPATRAALAERARAFVADLAGKDPRSPEFQRKLDDVVKMGDREVRASSQVSNRMLQRPSSSPAGAAKRPGSGPAADAQVQVADTLAELRRTVTELDPGRADLKGPRRLFGLLPGGQKVQRYFDRYQDAQSQLDAIIRALASGQDALRRDNAAIEQEKAELWATMGKLTEYVVLARALDTATQEKVTELSLTDPKAADALTADALFPIRQRHQDLLTQLTVSAQGYLALDLVRRNNVELIKGVDRAQTTTVSALRTAVVVAQALSQQQLVLDQVSALNSTTSATIESTSRLLRQQTAQVHEQAASATVDVEVLQRAFDEVFATMDAIDTFKLKAVENLATTVDALEGQMRRSRSYVARTREAEARDAAAQIEDRQ